MAGTKLVCPHCTAVLKSGKTLPVGKQVTCVKCKHRFSFTTEMSTSSTVDTHDGAAFSLAETQAGTMKSPITGMSVPAKGNEPATAVPSELAPAKTKGSPAPMSKEPAASPEDMEANAGMFPSGGMVSRPIRRGGGSAAGVWIALALIFFVLFLSAGGGLIYVIFMGGLERGVSDAKLSADVKKKIPPPAPTPSPAAPVEPQKKIVPPLTPGPSPTPRPPLANGGWARGGIAEEDHSGCRRARSVES